MNLGDDIGAVYASAFDPYSMALPNPQRYGRDVAGGFHFATAHSGAHFAAFSIRRLFAAARRARLAASHAL